jgi:hypothetical protein
MDAEWFQGGYSAFESRSFDTSARHEWANYHETLVPQHGVDDDFGLGGHKSRDGNAVSNLLWPVVEIVEMSLPEVLDDEWPDSDDRDGVGRVDG